MTRKFYETVAHKEGSWINGGTGKREEVHGRECTYDEFNTRTSIIRGNGRQHTPML
jgi:hypothetical protein